MTLPPPSDGWLRLKKQPHSKSTNVKCWSDLDTEVACCEICVDLEFSNFSNFSKKCVHLRPNVGPQTPNHTTEPPHFVEPHIVGVQNNPTIAPKKLPVKRNRIFATDGELCEFSHYLNKNPDFKNLCVPAMILSTKFELLDPKRSFICSNTSLVDQSIQEFSQHALWTTILKPVPGLDLSVGPCLAVKSSDALPLNAAYGKCGRPCICNSTHSLVSGPAMLGVPALDGCD